MDLRKLDVLLKRIDSEREELAHLVLDLANTVAPVGSEAVVAEVVHRWYTKNGIPSKVIELIEGRASTVARLAGVGGGHSLIFNAHLDTEASGPDYQNLMGGEPDPNLVGSWREDNHIFGYSAINDRHAHALFMLAARAVMHSGLPLYGDVILTSVLGETGQAPVDEYRGLRYAGKGLGTSYLLDHGLRGDYALVSETTDFALSWFNCGANYYKVTVRGKNMYTPRLKRGATWRESPNAILKAAYVVQAIEMWAEEYARSRTTHTVCGLAVPQAQVGAIRGGIPWRPHRSSPYAALYVDVRVLPGDNPDDITAMLREVVESVGVGASVELVMSKAGAIGEGIEPLADAIRAAHRSVRKTEPPAEAESAVVSMWRDTNVFNRAGIPAVNYGPSRAQAAVQGTGHLDLDELVDTVKIYALTILQMCGELTPTELPKLG